MDGLFQQLVNGPASPCWISKFALCFEVDVALATFSRDAASKAYLSNLGYNPAMKHLALAVLGTLAAGSAVAEDCKFSRNHNVDVAAAGVKRFVLAAGAGDLKVRGEDNRNAVNAGGRACASSQELLDQIDIETRREGDVAYIRVVMPSESEGLSGWSRYAYLDLTVLAPKSAIFSIEDSSGDLQASNLQSADVADSSGDLAIRDIVGDLKVSDSSGEIEIERIGGSLALKDSSGDIAVDNVQGDVEVTVDSSGDIEIDRVGSVHILIDSSGEITVGHVQRDVKIDSDSSGSINVNNVGGSFTVGVDSSGSIDYNQVTGAVRVPEQD